MTEVVWKCHKSHPPPPLPEQLSDDRHHSHHTPHQPIPVLTDDELSSDSDSDIEPDIPAGEWVLVRGHGIVLLTPEIAVLFPGGEVVRPSMSR